MDMNVVDIEKLMKETRKLASLFRVSTGQTLPVSNELARYDAKRLLLLNNVESKSHDFIFTQGPHQNQQVHIKSRVIFEESKTHYRIGNIKLDLSWQWLGLILYDAHYEPTDIYLSAKEQISQAVFGDSENSITINKFKAISQLVWTKEQGLQWDELWTNLA